MPAFAPAATAEPDPERCLRLQLPPRAGTVAIPGLEGVLVEAGDELVCDILPVAGIADRWASTAFAVDVVFDDGSVLSDGGSDQHGTAVTPEAQADAKRLWVDQWNRRIVDLTAFEGRRIRGVLAAWRADEAVEVFLGDVIVRPAPPRPADLLGWVDTRRGTHSSDRFSRGNTAPVAGLPHGGVFALPMTDASAGNWPYRFQMARPALQAFATSRIPSPWIGDRGVFQLMPSPLARPDIDREARALAFERAGEHAGPDAYRVELGGADGRIEALITAGDHVVGMQFRSDTGTLSVVVDHLGEAVSARWAVEDEVLHLDVRLRDAGEGPDHHVHAVVPNPELVDLTHVDGKLRGSVRIAVDHADIVVGVSTIDAEQARRNAAGWCAETRGQQDLPGAARADGRIDALLRGAADAWRSALGRIEIPDPDAVPADVMRSIAGSLARVFSSPIAHDEPAADGRRYRSPVDGDVRGGRYSANNGFWDTYRTAWPLLGLLAPPTAGALADGFVQHAADAGWVARWSAPGPVDCMTGTTSDTVFAGLAAQGVPLRREEAYASALRHATVPASDPRVGRKGLGSARFRGYVDTDTHEGLSWTLDNAINDASAARLARSLADDAVDPDRRERLETESEYLARRALSYRDVFHPRLGFFLGRRPDGVWRVADNDFDPAEWGYDYTETNAWGTAFTAPHDGAGLADLHGGEEALGAKLDAFFGASETADPANVGSYGFVIHEMSEARDVRMGMLGLSNQPAHHIPFMYCFAGRHDDAHRLVVEARDRLFAGSEIGQGYPGDEDNGEMSAWYLFSVLGLYPLVPGSGELVLSPPLLPRVDLRIEGRADPLVIAAENAGAPHIRGVRIDGDPWSRISIPPEVIRRARRIDFELSDEPVGWAGGSRPSSFSREFGVAAPARDLLATVPGTVTDDTAETVRELTAGDAVELALAAPGAVGMYTVTLAGGPAPFPARPVEAVVARWRVEGVTTDGRAVSLDARDETFADPGQTRPFRIREHRGVVLAAIRFIAEGPVFLAQVEAFV